MTATITLLDKFKKLRSLPSDNAAAVALGVTRATVSGWRHGVGQAGPASIARMARAIGEDEARWLAQVEAERARSEPDRKVWAALARRLGAAAALAAVAITTLPYPAAAHSLTAAHPRHYAKSLRRVWTRWLASWSAARNRDASPMLA